ncbi:MAG TPA: hypothetical protein VEZ89_16800, partial [Rubrivivax sp.]|nr:hypothetical protein [Rubrivivax sp.]
MPTWACRDAAAIMRGLMHQILLRVLLLVVFFNTTVGAPLHAAEHLHGDATAPVQASVGSGFDQRADADGCVTDEHGTADGQCIWCSSYAQLATALGGGDVVAL